MIRWKEWDSRWRRLSFTDSAVFGEVGDGGGDRGGGEA
jgi:hypothetical protein